MRCRPATSDARQTEVSYAYTPQSTAPIFPACTRLPCRRFQLNCVFVVFFQAEDGLRDIGVPGVQTCALPIFANLQSGSGTAAHVEDHHSANPLQRNRTGQGHLDDARFLGIPCYSKCFTERAGLGVSHSCSARIVSKS